MLVVRCGPAELVIGDGGTRTCSSRPTREVLQVAAATEVAHEYVELAVRPEIDHAAVVVAALRLAGVCLYGAQADNVPVERQRRSIPQVSVHAVAQQWRIG